MAEFSRLVITNKGQALLAKMMTGEGNVEFTKISTSDMEYTLEQLEALTEFSGVKQTVSVAKVTRTNGVAVMIEAIFNNLELTQGYHMRALGLYAIDPDDGEILYAVTTEMSGCCYMPAYNGVTVSGACIKLVTTVGNAENVSLEVDPGVYATVGEIKELRESVDGIETWKDSTQKRLDNWGPTIVGHGQVINSLRDSIGNLKPVATSGNYNDLSNKPSIPAAVRVKGNAESSYRTGDVNLTAENIGAVPLIEGNINVNSIDIFNSTNSNTGGHIDFHYSGDSSDFTSRIIEDGKGILRFGFSEDYYYVLDKYGFYPSEHAQRHLGDFGSYWRYICGNELYCYGVYNMRGNLSIISQIPDGEGVSLKLHISDNGQIGSFYPTVYDEDYNVGTINLGDPSYRWTNIYATNGTIQTSDRNEKNTIEELSEEKAKALIYGLNPSTYQMNEGTSGRIHWGLISQDIEELFEDIGMTSLDFAGFIKSPKIQRITEDENGKELKKTIEKVIEGEYNYSLRYDEFIAPIIKVIQSQHEEIETLKQETQILKQQMQQINE